MSKNKIKWGYAGVFPGDFNIWKGDPFTNQLNFMIEHGFQSYHLGMSIFDKPEKLAQAAEFNKEHGLSLVLGFHGDYFTEDRAALTQLGENFLRNLEKHGRELCVSIVTTGAGRIHRFKRQPNLEEQIERLATALAPVARGCRDLGCPLGIENHGDYYCSDLVELCGRTPGLGIFLDTGNCFLVGEQPVPACCLAAPYVIGTHFKDHFVHPDPHELKFVLEGSPLGEGDVGLRQIYTDLLAFAPEPSSLAMQWEMVPPKGMNAFECLERSWAFVRSLPDPDR